MASFSRSFKPPAYLRPMRPGLSSRKSNSSETSSPASSTAALSESEEEQFILSGANTPVTENAPLGGSAAFNAISAGRGAVGTAKDRSQNAGTVSRSLDNPRLNHARPIAIELPGLRKLNTAPAHTPPEPLSARGERPGGYFPLHEDPKSRVHHPHPFQLDIKKARHNSINLAVDASSPEKRLGVPPVSLTMPDNTTHYQLVDAGGSSGRSSTSASTNTPVASYLPSGLNESTLPMGKYYPSNYESRQKQSSPHTLRPPTSAPSPLPGYVKSESQVPRLRGEAKHARTDSEAKRRLQQYQRDMIAQATAAARQVLGGAVKPSSAAAGGISLHNIHLGASLVHKPISPRLLPLGSPGPVTPMDLEGEGDSYLSCGRPMSGPDAEREMEEIARAMRMEDERRRREGATSPAVELGPVTF